MSESMVEKVARAIYEKWAESEGSETTWDELLRMQPLGGYKHAKDVYRLALAEARVAIEAMREPTDAMVQALHEAMFVDKYDATDQPMLGAGIEAFIDAALNEQVAG